MSKKRLVLPRRTFLRGLGGIALALPALEIMSETTAARAAVPPGPPTRYAFFYGGVSTGTYVDNYTTTADLIVPSTQGLGYEITPSLEPLATYGVQDDVSVVSGLTLPWGNAGAVPPGGRRTDLFHGGTVTPQISGYRAETDSSPPGGPTSDQIVADAIAGDTIQKCLVYRVQTVDYDGTSTDPGGGIGGRLSWKRGANGDLVEVDPIVSPHLAYQSLFSGFAPADPVEAQKAEFELRRRKSVLDLVRGNTERLLGRLGKADNLRMQQHFDELRALEKKLSTIAPLQQGACQLPTDPGEDPPIGGAIIEWAGEGVPYSTTEGYSDEDKRADVLTDLVAMAFACDLSRVASVQLTMWKCYMNMFQIAGWQSDMHNLTHGGGPLESVGDAVAWNVKQLARLAKKLKDKPEPDGSTVLDHSALVLTFEGGHGIDPGAGEPAPHSTENMTCLIAGRAGGLKSGQHVVAKDKHPASVVVSAMNAVGVDGGLGEVDANIPELFA